jgi:methylthioribose-1-phosphate isomerase
MGMKHLEHRPISFSPERPREIQIIDQRFLPHELKVEILSSVDQVEIAIRDMWVRGAPLIGAVAGFGAYFAICEEEEGDRDSLKANIAKLLDSRPTAVNLQWAIEFVVSQVEQAVDSAERIRLARAAAEQIVENEIEACRAIGDLGLKYLREKHGLCERAAPWNFLTHCNAGALACIEHGTATAPIYAAHEQGFDIHVWVDETRPRNQGARLTAWELSQRGIPHTVICDNAAGHVMQKGLVDFVIVGTDRTTSSGDVANKIGTYQKALAAKDNNIPFFVAAPSSSVDWSIQDGLCDIPIEERDPEEVRCIRGLLDNGESAKVLLTCESSSAKNFAFDVTPHRLITALMTERGVCSPGALRELFPDYALIQQ